jgi:hypothetical protein
VLLLFLRLGQDVHKDGGCAYCQDENGQLWMGRPHRTCQAEHPCSGSDCARQQRSLQGLHRNSSSGTRLAVNSGYAKRSQCVPWKMPVSWRKIPITRNIKGAHFAVGCDCSHHHLLCPSAFSAHYCRDRRTVISWKPNRHYQQRFRTVSSPRRTARQRACQAAKPLGVAQRTLGGGDHLVRPVNSVSRFTRSSKLSNLTSPCNKLSIRGIRLHELWRKSCATGPFNWRNGVRLEHRSGTDWNCRQ